MALAAIKRRLATLPMVRRLADSARGRALRHWIATRFEDRRSYTFTQFRRLPTQFDVLTGPVLDRVAPAGASRPIRIVVLASSTGAEPYSIASEIRRRRPDIAFTIDAYDIDPDVVATARAADYAAADVRSNALVTEEFIDATFDRRGDRMTVKPGIAQFVRFDLADAASPGLADSIGLADLVFAQNVMCNLRRPLSRRIFDNAVALMKPHAALFVDGMDVDMRAARSRKHGLEPFTPELEAIHHEAELVRGERYPWLAAGLEPFARERSDRDRRYATIFFRGAAARSS